MSGASLSLQGNDPLTLLNAPPSAGAASTWPASTGKLANVTHRTSKFTFHLTTPTPAIPLAPSRNTPLPSHLPTPPAPFGSRDELIARNKALVAALTRAARANGAHDALQSFRTLSAAFQKGEVASMAFFGQFRQLFGEEVCSALFPELVLLLPDRTKREELARIYEAFDRSRPLHAATLRAAKNSGWGVRGGGGRVGR